MHTAFAVLTLLITLMSGGLVFYEDGGSEADPLGSSSTQVDDESDGGPGADPWG